MAIRLVPPILVPAARVVLQQQGINPAALRDDGTIPPDEAFALFYDTITIETAFTPPIRVKVNEPSDPTTVAVLNQLRPRMIFSGRAGTFAFQPYGAPTGNVASGMKTGAGAVLGLLGVWWLAKSLL